MKSRRLAVGKEIPDGNAGDHRDDDPLRLRETAGWHCLGASRHRPNARGERVRCHSAQLSSAQRGNLEQTPYRFLYGYDIAQVRTRACKLYWAPAFGRLVSAIRRSARSPEPELRAIKLTKLTASGFCSVDPNRSVPPPTPRQAKPEPAPATHCPELLQTHA